MVTVRTRLPESAVKSSSINADLDVDFADHSAHYKQAPFQVTKNGIDTRITGTIPTTLSDFKIDPPTLLTVPVKNDIPVKVDMMWREE